MLPLIQTGGSALPSGTPNQVLATDASGSSSDIVQLRALVQSDLPNTLSAFGTSLPNIKLVPSFTRSVGASNGTQVKVYQCPTSRRAIALNYQINNYGSATSSFSPCIGGVAGASGVYFPLAGTLTAGQLSVINGTASGNAATAFYVMEAGETYNLLQITSTNFWVVAMILEFDNTSPLRTAKVVNPASGDNALYTPSGSKNGLIVGGAVTNAFAVNASTQTSLVLMWNNTSGAITTYNSYLPSGTSSSSAATRLNSSSASATAHATTSTGAFFGCTVANGDTLSVNLSANNTSGGLLYCSVLEF